MDYKQVVADTLAPALTDVLSAADIYQKKLNGPRIRAKGTTLFQPLP